MTAHVWHGWLSGLACLGLMGLSACSSTGPNATLEQRYAASGSGPARYSAPRPAPYAGMDLSGRSSSTAGGSEVAYGATTYTVRPGDTLNRIAIAHGRTWKDLALWNNLENPDVIEVGQVLQVVPPSASDDYPVTGTPTSAPARPNRVETRPLEPAAPEPVDAGGVATDAQGVRWSWPASGPVLNSFGEKASKGISIAGRAGDPVMAAADGKVVYAGSGLRGYGNLIIVKHANNYLTAYAHNQALLVKEDQAVRRGQRIAEMGAVDAERVKLHFELRRDGKPLDPVKFLPVR